MSVLASDAVASTSTATSSNALSRPSITSKCLACAPVTALEFLSPSKYLLAAQGPWLKLYDVSSPKKPMTELKLWSFQRIHGIVRLRNGVTPRERLIVFGGKQVAIVEVDQENCSLSVEHSWVANDWLLAACWLGKDSILVVTSHNTLQRYDISLQEGEDVTIPQFELHCHERPLLWSACFSRAVYEDEKDVYIAVGTIMNEILIWRPFLDQGRIERRFIGHHGSVFFVVFSPVVGEDDEHTLASGSDDRDVRLWRWKAASDQCTSTILRGHTHRPWKATFCKNSNLLVTVGEDLRCLLWDTSDFSFTSPISPVGQYKGHEGKNIWSVAVSEIHALIATGGSDGAIRLWPLTLEQFAKAIFTAPQKDIIVAFDVTDKHVVLLTRDGNVYHGRTGIETEAPRHLFKIESNKRSLQAEISIQSDSIWIWTREGRVYCFSLEDEGALLQSQDIATMPVIVSASEHGKKWALYDRRSRTVQVWERSGDTLLQKKAQSPALEADKLPKFLTWLDEHTLVVADAVSSIWIFAYANDTSEIPLLYSGRLSTKGTFALQSDDSKSETFWVGNKDGCNSYRLKPNGCDLNIEMLGSNCLHYGVVKDIYARHPSSRSLYLACDNTSGRVVDQAGNVLTTVHCPASSAQTLRLIVQDDRLYFYNNSGTQLHLQTRDVSIDPILQEGVQGREIWSVDLCRLEHSQKILCATTAEDNTVKISGWSSGSTKSLRTLYRYPEPDGTLQNARWSKTSLDSAQDSAILFITAAKERLYALKVTLSPEEDTVAVLKLGEAQRDSTESDDSRTMCLDVLKIPESSTHAILAGSSDGSLKLWHFDEMTSIFSLQWSSAWHDRCLLSIRLLYASQKLCAISGATDGRLAVWNLNTTSAVPAHTIEDAHQSGVNCLDACFQDGMLHIVSGGDDCTLAYATLSLQDQAVPNYQLIKELDAHSSSLKGVSMLGPHTFVSTSTDQRLTSWRLLEGDSDEPKIVRVASTVTSVADIADISVLPSSDASEHALVAVCGLGLEVLEVLS